MLNMHYNLHKISDISYIVSMMIEKQETNKLAMEFNEKIKTDAKIKGFRRGKVPLNVLINHYGKDKYLSDLKNYIATKAFEVVVKQDDRIKPVVPPKFEFADWEEGKDFVFTAMVVNEPPDTESMFIRQDTDISHIRPHVRYSEPIKGIPGQMPIVDGKLPPHMAGVKSTENITDYSDLPGASKIQKIDNIEPEIGIPERTDQKIKVPEEHKVQKKINDKK
jgi:hypothetical protein